jgi:hypothetical protein
MASNQTTEFTAAPTWLAMAKQDGYYLKLGIITTLIMGMYLHVTSLFIGRELLLRYILTPSFDAVLAAPMTYAGIVGWLMWRRVIHPDRWHRFVYGFTIVYFTVRAAYSLHHLMMHPARMVRQSHERT